jgi:YD repeat-containing protein
LFNGSYRTDYTYHDGMLRAVQSQSVAADGSGARIVSGSKFDGRGLQTASLGPVKVNGAAGSGLVQVQDTWLPVRTDVDFDGGGRPVTSTTHVGSGSASWRDIVTRTAYDGLTTTTTPPKGGAARSTTTDLQGNPVKITEYTQASGTAGASQNTTFAYRADGLLTSMKDPAGNVDAQVRSDGPFV